jgi:Trk K+ transport system NAD-binding subunit
VSQQTGVFDAGEPYSLTVSTIPCYFQVDFFTGDVLNQLSTTMNYSTPVNNLIASAYGGVKKCDVEPVSVSTTTSTTVAVEQDIAQTAPSTTTSTTIEDTPVVESESNVEVAAVSITRDPQVATEVLATTGSNTTELIMVGTALLLFGVASIVIAHLRKRRRN